MSPESAVDEQYLRRAVEAATHAPSIHNTQPWRFRLSGDGEQGTVELYADRERSLSVLDPTGRQMLMSCGAALLFLKVALRADGLDADIDLLPDQDRDHLASVTVRRGASPSSQDSALAEAVSQRHTQRSPFDPREVAPELLDELRKAAEAEGAWLSLLHRRDDQLALITVLARADHEESMDAAYRDELRAWVRTDPSPDGIPVAVLPGHGERHSEVTIRDFNPDRVAEEPDAAPANPPVDEHPALVVLGTDGDDSYQHLIAGMALGRLLLQGAAGGLTASMLGQVIDRPRPRTWLRHELGLLGEPQMVLRVGYPTGPVGAATGRRPIDEVLLP